MITVFEVERPTICVDNSFLCKLVKREVQERKLSFCLPVFITDGTLIYLVATIDSSITVILIPS